MITIEMSCTSAQPTASNKEGGKGEASGARVMLVQRTTSGDPSRGARLELFLDEDHKNEIQLGDVKTLTIG